MTSIITKHQNKNVLRLKKREEAQEQFLQRATLWYKLYSHNGNLHSPAEFSDFSFADIADVKNKIIYNVYRELPFEYPAEFKVIFIKDAYQYTT